MNKAELKYVCVSAYKEMYDKIFQYVIENNGIVELRDEPIKRNDTTFHVGTVLIKLELDTDEDDQFIRVYYDYSGIGTKELTTLSMNDFAAIIYRIK